MTMQRSRGSSMLEFALSALVLLLLAAGLLNYGMALRAAIAVSAAARAGAQYGSLSTCRGSNICGMQAASGYVAPNYVYIIVRPVQACRCSNGSAVSCIGSCPSGPVALYVDVTARATAPTLFRYSGLPFSGVVSARAVMRAR